MIALEPQVVVRGGGDLATGICHKLVKCGFKVLVLETYKPSVIRRAVSFANVVYENKTIVESVEAQLAYDYNHALNLLAQNIVPVLIDPQGKIIMEKKFNVVVDAIIAKKNIGTNLKMADIVIGVGPGFTCGEDVHAVIETNRGHNLGKVLYEGTAAKNTGVPGSIMGITDKRVIKAHTSGKIRNSKEIGCVVKAGEIIGFIDNSPVKSKIDGVIRGLIKDGYDVKTGMEISDIDPRGEIKYCYSISDKARAIGGGVLEAILTLQD